jgi:hypothetical protein
VDLFTISVKVLIEMTDEEALIAQGVENNARQDPSFIERALFVAGIIRELGKTDETRKNAQTIAYRALQIDESLVSRMNCIATGIPMELIQAIGPAHGVGRRIGDPRSGPLALPPASDRIRPPHLGRDYRGGHHRQ